MRCKAKGMAQKNLKVEKSLVKFEDEFLRQKDMARLKKEADDLKYRLQKLILVESLLIIKSGSGYYKKGIFKQL